ncbi:MAG: atoB [Ilumatobacteraceae bacterium]|nr:atoB [Ilumatobacteraceae bacterium]
MSAAPPVYVLGGAQTDFARNFSREGLEISDLVAEVVSATLADAQVGAADIGTIHVGNAFGQLFTRQGQLGAMPATMDESLWGIPASRHEAACASGSIAVLAAMAEIEAGRYESALVIGAEQQRNVPGDLAAQHLGAAAWIGHEGQDAKFMWPYMFDKLIDVYDDRFGVQYAHLAEIARINLENGKRNPNAHTRAWKFDDRSFTEDDHANPVIEGRVRRQDCGQVTDGGAGVVLCSRAFAEAHCRRHGRSIDDLAVITGWGHRTASLSFDAKVRRSAGDPLVLPHVNQAITDAFARAGVADVHGLDGIETHDCFSMTEYMAIDHFGLTAPGESWKAIEDGTIAHDGALPINPSGGLIGLGHPVGATGVRMLWDAVKQVIDRAGDYQVDGADTFATLNVGGSATTVVSFVVSSASTGA